MIQKIFSIFDEKAEAFMQPFYCETSGVAIRHITDCLSNPDHQFSKHPSDYTLFNLGEFNNLDGSINHNKKAIGNLVEFIPQKPTLLGKDK